MKPYATGDKILLERDYDSKIWTLTRWHNRQGASYSFRKRSHATE